MKLPTTSLLILAAAAMGIAGCETQSSAPLATSPMTKPAVKAPPRTLPKGTYAVGETEVVRAAHETASEPSPLAESRPAETPKPAEAAGTRPKADREPTKPGDPEKITFDDLILGMEKDMVYRPFMLTDRAKSLEGKRVRLTGEMYAAVTGKEKLKEFIVLRNKECKYGAGGQADHVADVLMKEGHTAKFTIGTIRVEGTLRINPVNDDKTGVTNHIYVLEDAEVK